LINYDGVAPVIFVSEARIELRVQSTLPIPEGWIAHIHPQGWVYFYHPKTRVVTNDDIRTPDVLDVVEKYMATYPFSDLTDGMELLTPHDPQPNEHMFSLVVNHNSCMAGYSMKDVQAAEWLEADHGAFQRNEEVYLTDLRPQ
jgi:hypothetical protein